MKSRWMTWIASGLIVSVPVSSSVAQAEPNSLTQLFPALVGVQLTPEQQSQLENLSQQSLPRVQALLTPEQRVQFNNALSQGNRVGVAALSLNLSVTQRLQIRNILPATGSQLAGILTLEQQQQIQQNVPTLQKQGYYINCFPIYCQTATLKSQLARSLNNSQFINR